MGGNFLNVKVTFQASNTVPSIIGSGASFTGSEVLTGFQVDWVMGGNFLNVNVAL